MLVHKWLQLLYLLGLIADLFHCIAEMNNIVKQLPPLFLKIIKKRSGLKEFCSPFELTFSLKEI